MADSPTVGSRRKGRLPGSPKTPGSGRVAGTPNKATADVKALAQQHGPDIIALLYRLAQNVKTPPQARISAAGILLDRGYGKAPQAITGGDGGPLRTIVEHIHQSASEQS